MNQAEVVHASWAHRDRPNLSLLEAAHMDTRDSLLLEAELKEYMEGTKPTGTGPSLAARNFRRELDKAVRCGREMHELAETITGDSGHRSKESEQTTKSKRKKTSKKSVTQTCKNQSDNTYIHTSVYTYIHTLFSDASPDNYKS